MSWLPVVGWILWNVCASLQAQQTAVSDPFFENKVRPILATRCWNCHSGESGKSQGNLRLDHGSFILNGGDSGPAIAPGNPEDSLLYQAVTYRGYEMPPDGRLPENEVETLREWIAKGGEWPDERLPEDIADRKAFDLDGRKKAHWVWQPRTDWIPPRIAHDTWSATSIDPFIAERVLAADLQPSPAGDRVTLARRLYLDLTGLPPTSEDIDRIEGDSESDWYSKLVDQLLADPQFGVRWARHWLDLVRYAQSRGHEFDEDIPAAEAYRDYVVRAFNADLPYDQFMIEHIAGDLIEVPRLHPTSGSNESVLATGFWHFGEWVHSPVDSRKDETDRFDNMVDVFSKTFLGVTVACARCHDHKFDAISTEDYYALYGYLRSSHYRLVRYETDPIHRQAATELESLRAPLRSEFQRAARSVASDLLTRLDHSEVDQVHVRELIERIAATTPFAKSRLPSNDPRVRWDARSPDGRLWTSDGVIYGLSSQPGITVNLHSVGEKYRWGITPFPQGARDAFWNPMTQDVASVNRLNRYAQISEAGKILPTGDFVLDSGNVSYLVRGSFRAFVSVDSHRLIAGPLHGETLLDSQVPDDPSRWQYRWVTQSLPRYRGKTVHLEFSPIQDQEFAIAQVIDGDPPAVQIPSLDSLASRAILDETRDALRQWLENPQDLAEQPMAIVATALEHVVNSSEGWTDSSQAWLAELHGLAARWRESEQQLQQRLPWHSHLAMAMRDGTGLNDCVLIRGNHLRPGNEVPRRTLESLDPSKTSYPGPGSGRLALARQLACRDNPLVARVIVNRIWHHLLGRGIAPTTDDFGVLGMPPSHPELLDHLANDLIAKDWSIKSTVRAICLSSTYRQDSRPSQRSLSQDPDNRLLSHARVRRLESEAIRDGLLAITGQLDLRWMPDASLSVPVHLTDFLEGRGRPGRNGPLDGQGRRSLYLEVRRNFLNPLMTAFDMPNPFSSMGRRNVSNVPAQALILLNDPLVHELAARWADRIQASTDSAEAGVQSMMRTVLLRDPSPKELQQGLEFVGSPEFASLSEGFRALAHMLLNSKELLYRF